MFAPGDVIGFFVKELNKEKYRLCVTPHGHYAFVSTQDETGRTYPGDYIVPCNELPFLTPTKSGFSRISCATVVSLTDRQLTVHTSLRKCGTVSRELLRKIIGFIEGNPTIPPEIQEAVLEGLGEWL